MIKDVEVMSCANFKSNLGRVTTYQELAAISCRQSPGHPAGDDFPFVPDCSFFLSLFFDDCGPAGTKVGYDGWEGQKPFTEAQAKQVLDFVDGLAPDTILYVHCQAGISRSGAIGSFIAENYTNQNMQAWRQRHSWINPNSHVYSLLRREMYKRKGIEIE